MLCPWYKKGSQCSPEDVAVWDWFSVIHHTWLITMFIKGGTESYNSKSDPDFPRQCFPKKVCIANLRLMSNKINLSPFLSALNWFARIQAKVGPTTPPLTLASDTPPTNRSISSTCLKIPTQVPVLLCTSCSHLDILTCRNDNFIDVS